ncbi:MAG: hypothetical protein E7655_03365 [Ruminococcaceae bacterium]|nr:hypothetical protein [Oscillospiraceae bacterium]
MRSWTEAQTDAIEYRGGNLLVSAAAGSGKTAVLTERLLRLITSEEEQGDLSRMLIVTFTRKAAGELRDRIRLALESALEQNPDSPRLNRQLLLLGSARISTIHAFCFDVVKNHFPLLGLPAGMRIADETESLLLQKNVMDETLARFYAEKEDFAAFAAGFSSEREESKLGDIFSEFYNRIASFPSPVGLIESFRDQVKKAAEGSLAQTVFFPMLEEAVAPFLSHYQTVYDAACRDISADEKAAANWLPAFSADRLFLSQAQEALQKKDFSALCYAFGSYVPPSLKAIRGADETLKAHQARRDAFKKSLKNKKDTFFSCSEESVTEQFRRTADTLTVLAELLSAFEDRFAEEKLRRRMLTYADLERFAHRLLIGGDGKPTAVAGEIAKGFDHIFIDEYQDTNAVQDAIFSALSNGHNRFMVGDVKQSIYAFRGSEPEIFESYRSSDAFRCIRLSHNFRSDSGVIDFINVLFDRLFGHGNSRFSYDEGDALFHGAAGDDRTPVQIVGSVGNAEGEDEALFVASEIKKLVDMGRDPASIAVLYRSSSKVVARIRRLLGEYGIPRASDSTDDFFSRPEILLTLCLLHIIDNPRRDVYLLGALMSPLFGFTADDMALIRQGEREASSLYDALLSCESPSLAGKKADVLAFLDRYRHLAATLPAESLLFRLYREKDLLSFGKKPLMQLYTLSLRFGSGSYRSLYAFLAFLNDLIASGKTPATLTDASEESGEVAFLTVHGSKGLEFDTVFLVGCDRDFNRSDLSKPLLYDKSGIALYLPHPAGFAREDTLLRRLICHQLLLRSAEEEQRILYTALTRAKKQLILTYTDKDPQSLPDKYACEPAFFTRETIFGQNSFLRLIFSALPDIDRLACCELSVFDRQSLLPLDTVREEDAHGESAPLLPFEEEKAVLKERFSFVYPHPTGIPAKVSVSTLYPDLLDESDDALDLSQGGSEKDERDLFAATPAFLGGQRPDGIAKGNATHAFMQFCDFESVRRNGVVAELERLVKQGFLSQKEAESVDVSALARFFDSELFGAMSASPTLYREKRFNVFLPASLFASQNKERFAERQILVQGVIDCLFEDETGGLTLVDYKTDRVFGKEAETVLRKRHARQLVYYAEAVRRLLGRPVSRACLYSFSLGRPVEIDLSALSAD